MNIVIQVFGSLNAGGAESRMMDVYNRIDRSKVQFHFISLSTDHDQFYEPDIIRLGGEIYKIPSPREIGLVKHFLTLYRIFKQYDINRTIVHSHTLYHSGLVLLAARFAKIKRRIAHARSSSSVHSDMKSNIMIYIGKKLISWCATAKFAVSINSANFLFNKDKNVVIIPNAIDIDKYIDIPLHIINQYKEEFLLSDQFVLGHIGRFEPMKNHKFLIELFYKYVQINPHSKLILVGNGSLYNSIQKLVNELSLSDKVVFCGIRNDVNYIIKLFDCLLLPSIYEGLPGVILEAQAAGISSLCSNTITNDVNLNLGLVKYIELNDINKWLESVVNLHHQTVNPNKIKEAFNARKLTIESELQVLYKYYL